MAKSFARLSERVRKQDASLRLARSVAPPALDYSPIDFRQLVEQSVDMICQVAQMHDGRLVYEYVSPSAVEVVGWTAAEMKNVPHHIIYPPASMAVIREAGKQLILGAASTVVTVEAIRKDGHHIWVENRVRVLEDRGGGDRTVVVCMRDITERKLLQDRLASLVLVDALTGVGNRRAFDAAIDREWKQVAERDGSLSLLLIDIDHFKRINDTHGHQKGDECIRLVAEKVRSSLRRSDSFVARYGGDELAVLLPGINERGAHAVGSRLCRRIAAGALLPPQEAGRTGQLTISCGASTAHARVQQTLLSPAALIAAADHALYRAKSLGRNQAAVAALG